MHKKTIAPHSHPVRAHKHVQLKKQIPIAYKIFFVLVVLLMGAALKRYLEDEHILVQKNEVVVERKKMQEALGWGSNLGIDKKTGPLTRIRFLLRDKDLKPILRATVQITLSHADINGNILSQNSLTLPLSMVEPGVYRGQINLPLPGDWDTVVNAQIGDSSYQVTERFTLP